MNLGPYMKSGKRGVLVCVGLSGRCTCGSWKYLVSIFCIITLVVVEKKSGKRDCV